MENLEKNNIIPSYYSILPATIRYDKNLSSTAKLLYSEITALANKNGYCFASNKYFANLFGISETSVSLIINKLKKSGYIKVVINEEEGNKRYIFINDTPIEKDLNTSLKKFKDPSLKKFKDNITSINIFLSKDKNGLKAEPQKKEFGNEKVNFVLEVFKKYRGFYPTDRDPRRRAWNIVQKIETFLKKNPILIEKYNFNFEILLDKYFNALKKKDYFNFIENLDTVSRKLPIFFGAIEKKIQTDEKIKKIEEKQAEREVKNEPILDEDKLKNIAEMRKKLVEKFKISNTA